MVGAREYLTDENMRQAVTSGLPIPFPYHAAMAQEILDLRQRVTALQVGTVLEAQESPALTHIATALETLAGCVVGNVFVVGNVER